ncbi:MAG: ATP phosphoribosyltransferase regulatory subunit [Anaerolineae bacterium]
MQLSSSNRYEQFAASLQQLMGLHGYERLETPILQPADLFLTRAGDQIITRLFTFEHGGKQIALRPEYTSPAMNQYIRDGHTLPVRWQFSGVVFEEAEDSTQQQRTSIGAEAIGWPVGLADAEILTMAINGLQSTGVPNLRMHVGHVAFLRAMLGQHIRDARMQRFLLNHVQTLRQSDGRNRVREQVNRLLRPDRRGSEVTESPSPAIVDALLQPLERSQLMGGRTREDIQRRLLYKLERIESLALIEQALDELEQMIVLEGPRQDVMPELRARCAKVPEATALLDDWEALLRTAAILGLDDDCVVVTPALSRNWDYYSGIVFELHSGIRHLGGGGRYDELSRLLGATEPIPAVGFAYYVDDVLELLPSPHPKARVWTLQAGSVDEQLAAWLTGLRGFGIRINVQPDTGILRVNSAGELQVGDQCFEFSQISTAVGWLEAQS